MDCLGPILTIATDLVDCSAKHVSHIRDLEENLDYLRGEMQLLGRQSEDVKRRVAHGEQQHMITRRVVEGWLQDVSQEINEIAAILEEGDEALEKKCLARYCKFSSSYDLGKRVGKHIMRVAELTRRGQTLEVVSDVLPRPAVDELPLRRTVGLDSLYDKVCSCLTDDGIGIVGLYGKRGIGKTTLMMKINNDLLETRHDFDTVIWVYISQYGIVKAAQQLIGNKLEIIDNMWENRNQYEKAIQIFNIMKAKRFLLLLDNLQHRLDLSEIGVPIPNSRNRSKVILTTRSERICNEMEAQKIFKVEALEWEDALTLFSERVGPDILNFDPRIQDLAYIATEKCKGIPSALVAAGQALRVKDVEHWERMARQLDDYIKEEISGNDSLPKAFADEMPLGHTVGLDSLYATICSYLDDYKVKTIGLYGTGGVGKTTLLKKIYNGLLRKGYGHSKVFIWVAVSKQASVGAAQEVIRNKLQIPDSMWQGRTEDESAREIYNIMKTKTFVLLLDDVWQRLDLSKIGVPPLLEFIYGCKVIITTRFQRICNEMEVQRKFRVEYLAREQALALFLEKVGENTPNSHSDIPKLAAKVAERCKGLPLALVTVGRAMADKNSPQEWDQAIEELEKFPAEIPGMEDGLFDVLKLSYDSLRDDVTKRCFIYFSMFPKEYEIRIEELVEHWIGEGFFIGKDIYEARRRGHKIIEDLKNACLLEEGDGFKGCIKMHDVIHDMALWIAQDCGHENMNKIWVCESLGLVDGEMVTNWNEAERISLWGRNVEKLPKTPYCFNLHTLFVRECIQLKTLPRGFFQFMPLLRILDLSASHCLAELPDGVERLVNLEFINLSMTGMKELPIGIMKLRKLRCLLLDGMLPLIIPPHLISALSTLQLFSMYDGNALSAYRTPLLEELESIEPLDELSLSFRSITPLNKLLSSYKLQRCVRRLSLHDCRDLLLLELSSRFLNHLETLSMFNCLQLEEMKINVEKVGSKGYEQSYDVPNPELIVRNNQQFHKLRDVKIWCCPKLLHLTWLIYAVHLESLNVQFCKSMKEVVSDEYVTSTTQHASIFTRLTSLVVGAMPVLEGIYPRALLFPSLEVISVINCPKLKRLPFDASSAAKSLKKVEGDMTWWKGLEWKDESVKDIFINYFSPQYLADPIDPSGKVKGKKEVVVEGSTSKAAT